jgi:hypothetical protein
MLTINSSRVVVTAAGDNESVAPPATAVADMARKQREVARAIRGSNRVNRGAADAKERPVEVTRLI